ncbi:MAG: hypothetical protein KGI38_11140 [Thaumarchaeota archaeon]|nr:hypothetical protein [Nitrososphaerota archaeon]
MSVGRKTVTYTAAAALISIAIIAASFIYLGLPASIGSSSVQGPKSVLVIQLTDPPHVPAHTSSLNLTYSSLGLLVGEPTGTPDQFTTKTLTLTPSGGSATLDLLRLQNISQTIASASLPAGSVIYSVTFTVTSIKIDVNNTVSVVSLSSGGSSFSVTMASPSALSGTDVALLQLNPVVVDTPSGYQLIPSAVGVIRPSHGGGEDQVGWQQQLTNEDEQDLEHAQGNVTASLTALSVSGNVTSITVQVNNTGSVPVELNGIGLHGNFTVSGNICQSTETHTTETETESVDHSTTTSTSTATSTTTVQHCEVPDHSDEVVFVPVIPTPTSTTTTTSTTSTSTTTTTTVSHTCSPGQMSLVNGDGEDGQDDGLTLSPGQCVKLTFTGPLSFGESHFVLIPSVSSGQTYGVHIIASNGANEQLSCVLPLGPSSCKVQQEHIDQ